MNKPCVYEIRIIGVLTEGWSDWFEGLEIHPQPDGMTCLRGEIVDQAALLGALMKIHALNLELVSVSAMLSN